MKRFSFLIQREPRRQRFLSDYCQANFASTRTSSCGQPRRPLFVCRYDSPTGNHNMPNTCWFSERRFPLCSWDIWRSRETSACKDWCQASLLQEDFVWSYSLADELDENILLQVAKDHRITWIRKRVKAHLGGIQLRISPPRRTLLESSFALQEWNFATREKSSFEDKEKTAPANIYVTVLFHLSQFRNVFWCILQWSVASELCLLFMAGFKANALIRRNQDDNIFLQTLRDQSITRHYVTSIN